MGRIPGERSEAGSAIAPRSPRTRAKYTVIFRDYTVIYRKYTVILRASVVRWCDGRYRLGAEMRRGLDPERRAVARTRARCAAAETAALPSAGEYDVVALELHHRVATVPGPGVP